MILRTRQKHKCKTINVTIKTANQKSSTPNAIRAKEDNYNDLKSTVILSRVQLSTLRKRTNLTNEQT